MKKVFLAALLFFITAGNGFAQLDLPLLSPKASIMQNIGITKVDIRYNRPGVKGRVIWGDLVPYNEVWRTGANEATTIEFSTDIKVNGNIVPKGKYSLFTIPANGEWTVILNKVWDQWGLDYNDHRGEDQLRFKVKTASTEFTEKMLFYFSNTSRSSADLNFAWEKLKFSFTIESFLTKEDDKSVRLSPAASVYQTIGYTDFVMTYGSPAVNGRKIWGTLVPYFKVWRAGANEATTIFFSTDVRINGKNVPAGRYAMFAIPAPDRDWTIILNKKWDQWGLDYNKNKGYDFIKFKARPEQTSFNERLYFKFFETSDNSVTVALFWENLKASFKIDIDLESIALKHIKGSLEKAKENDWKIWLDAAQYGIENNLFKSEPLKWIDKSISINESFKGYYLKALYFYNIKHYKDALVQIDKCRDKGQSEQAYRTFVTQVDNLERKVRNSIK